MFKVVIIISCSSRQLIMDGWPGASTILNFAEAELPLKVILKVETPKLKMRVSSSLQNSIAGLEVQTKTEFFEGHPQSRNKCLLHNHSSLGCSGYRYS